jgi:hypothetical protein
MKNKRLPVLSNREIKRRDVKPLTLDQFRDRLISAIAHETRIPFRLLLVKPSVEWSAISSLSRRLRFGTEFLKVDKFPKIVV